MAIKGRQGDYQSPGRRAATINQVLKGLAKPIIEKRHPEICN